MLSATDLQTLRNTALLMMTESVTVQRLTEATSSSGAHKKVYATAATVACRRRPLTSDEAAYQSQVMGVQVTEFLMPHDADIRTSDRLVHSSGTYEVGAVMAGTIKVQLKVIAALMRA